MIQTLKRFLITDRWWAVACAVLVSIVVMFIWSLPSGPRPLIKKQISAPIFTVGDCITMDYERERWQTTTIMKIVEIGKSNYRIQYWLDGLEQYGEPNGTNSFLFPEWYKKIDCPEEK